MATMEHPERPEVFISYSHADQKWLDELLTQLKPLKDRSLLDCWSDKEISAGGHWRREIEQALRSVKVAILLVSPEFLASDFIAKNELPPLLRAANRGDMKLLWIPVGANNYKYTELAEFQAAHPPEKPLNSLRKAARQKALVAISDKIFEAVGAGTAAGRSATPSVDEAQATVGGGRQEINWPHASTRFGTKYKKADWEHAPVRAVDGKVTKIIVALITAIGTILAGYWGYWQSARTRHPVQEEIVERRFVGRVVDGVGQKRLRGAKVSLEAQGVPPVLYTDSEGIFSFILPPKAQEIRLVIEVSGYEPYDRRVAVSSVSNIEEIRLEKKDSLGDIDNSGKPTESSQTAPVSNAQRVLWEKNWHTVNEPHGFMGSSGPPEEGGGSWTNREEFISMLSALDLSNDASLANMRYILVKLVTDSDRHPGGETYYNSRYTKEIRDLEEKLKRGIRNHAIEQGIDVRTAMD